MSKCDGGGQKMAVERRAAASPGLNEAAAQARMFFKIEKAGAGLPAFTAPRRGRSEDDSQKNIKT